MKRALLLLLICVSFLVNLRVYAYAHLFRSCNEWQTNYGMIYSPKKSVSTFNGAFGLDINSARIIKSFDTLLWTHVSVLVDKNNKKCLVKQGTRNILSWHLRVARDKLGSEIAHAGRIPANHVAIIPAYSDFIGKLYRDFPATLHEFVPGIAIKLLPAQSKERVFIHQKLKVNMPKDTQGLTREVIRGMSTHEDLCKIAAFDTFIANVDRHRGNLFYDGRRNRFIAIDLEQSFRHDLAQCACRSIQALLDDKTEKISKEELLGLSLYRDTLYTLMQLYTPESIYNKLVAFSKEAGILLKPFKAEVTQKLKTHKISIYKNYASCEKLIPLLDALIQKYGIAK